MNYPNWQDRVWQHGEFGRDLVGRAWESGSDAADATLHRSFVDRADSDPDRIAIIDQHETLTYDDLWVRASALSDVLRGANPECDGEYIAIVLPKGRAQVVACLATVFLGAAYIPVDPAWPSARIHAVLNTAKPTILVTLDSAAVAGTGVEAIVRVDVGGVPAVPASTTYMTKSVAQSVCPSRIAYVIFTSGSTGAPKGVMMEHCATWNTIDSVIDKVDLNCEDRILALSDLHFDLSVFDIFGALAVGAAIVIPSVDSVRDPRHWIDLCLEHRVTVWNSVPALMEMMCIFAEESGMSEVVAAALRAVLLSGDWIPVGLPRRIRESISDRARCWGLGGATECAIWSIWYRIDPDFDEDVPSVPYGYSMPNQLVYVGGADLLPKPAGVIGEIMIAGRGLANGYLNDRVRTSDRFVLDDKLGSRVYLTGDLGRLSRSGSIEFLGRADSQVKVNGYRIELGEIESAARAIPHIESAVAAPLYHESSVNGLGLMIVTSSGAVEESQLWDLLGKSLPVYMIPEVLVEVPRLPVTANGKVDRSEIGRSLSSARRSARNKGSQALVDLLKPEELSEVQGRTAALWLDVLGSAPRGWADDFFDRGGRSIDAARLIGGIAREFGIQVAFSDILSSRSFANLCDLIESRSEAALGGSSVEEYSATPLRAMPRRLPPARTVVFLPPIGGSVLCYEGLARSIDETIGVVGIERLNHDDKSFDALARGYADAVKGISQGSSIDLVGWSMGALLSLEVASILLEDESPIDLRSVTCIDIAETPAGFKEYEGFTRAEMLGRFIHDLHRSGASSRESADVDSFLARCGQEVADDDILADASRRGLIPVGVEHGVILDSFKRFIANCRTLASFSGRVRYVLPNASLLFATDEDRESVMESWAGRFESATITPVVGDHYSCIQASGSSSTVVEELRRRLNGA